MSVSERILSKPQSTRRAFAVLLIPVAIALLWVSVVEPAVWVATSQEQWRDETRRELARARGRANSLEAVKQQVDALPSAQVWQRFYVLRGTEDGSGMVQQDVANLFAASGLTNQSITALPSEKAGPLTRYSVRVAASGTADQLKAFLSQLRQQPRYLRVDRMNVGAPQVQGADQNAVLTVSMDIVGFAGESSSTEGKKT